MKVRTIFGFGYWGWGNATARLVQAVDSVEASRGFKPPIFVDVRYQRGVRAKGFNGDAFKGFVGPARYRWMKRLGNRAIAIGGSGPRVIIDDPSAATELLDLAFVAARYRRRVLFYCACEFPHFNGKPHCHRVDVAELERKAARGGSRNIDIVEWPGGDPREMSLNVDTKTIKEVGRGRKSVLLGG